MDNEIILQIKGLRLESIAGNVIVDNVDLTLNKGEVLGLIGESGCGKSVTMRALMRLLPAARSQVTGRVQVDGQDVLALDARALCAFYGQPVPVAAGAAGPLFAHAARPHSTHVHGEDGLGGRAELRLGGAARERAGAAVLEGGADGKDIQ